MPNSEDIWRCLLDWITWSVTMQYDFLFDVPAFPCIWKDFKSSVTKKQQMSFIRLCLVYLLCLLQHTFILAMHCGISAYVIFLMSTSLQRSSFRISLMIVNVNRKKTFTKRRSSLRHTYMQAFSIVGKVHQVNQAFRRKIIYLNHAFFLWLEIATTLKLTSARIKINTKLRVIT